MVEKDLADLEVTILFLLVHKKVLVSLVNWKWATDPSSFLTVRGALQISRQDETVDFMQAVLVS